MTLNPEWLLDVSQHASADKVAAALRAATNLFQRGQCDSIDDYAWHNISAGVTQSLDASTAPPFSTQSVKQVCNGTSANQACVPQSDVGQAAATGTAGVGSIYFEGVAGQSYRCWLRWVNTDATTTDGAVTTFTATGSWQLLSPASVAVEAGKTGDQLRLRVEINGTRAETFWLAHAMLEKGQSVVAPYVATSGGVTATRPAALPDDEIAAIVARFKSNPQDPAR